MSDITIWHPLTSSNSWLFYTHGETLVINCNDPFRTYELEISGVHKLTILSSCQLYTYDSILLPSEKSNLEQNLDIIPEYSKVNVKFFFMEMLNSVIPQNFTKFQFIKDLIEFTKQLKELDKLQKIIPEPNFIINVNFHLAIMYSTLTVSLTIISILAYKYIKKTNVKLYKLDLAEIELKGNQND